MTSPSTFISLRKLGRNVSKVITKVPRAFKNVRASSKQRSKAVLPAVSSIYEISHLVDPFQSVPIKADDNEELNSLTSTSLTTTTVDSELSSSTTSLTGSELEDESDSDSDSTMSDDDIKLANIKIFGMDNGSVACVEAVSVTDDGEDDDNTEEGCATDTSITTTTKTSSLLSVTLEPIEEADEDAGYEVLTGDDDAVAEDDDCGCDGSIQRAKAMYQELQTIRASLSRSSDDNTTLSFDFTSSVDSTPVRLDVVAEREEAGSRASALSLARLQEDSPICFMDGIPMHTRPAVLSLLGRSSPLRNCYVEDEDNEEEDDAHKLPLLSTNPSKTFSRIMGPISNSGQSAEAESFTTNAKLNIRLRQGFQGLIASLEKFKLQADILRRSTAKLPHDVDKFVNIYLHPASSRPEQRKHIETADGEAVMCLEKLDHLGEQLSFIRQALETHRTQFRAMTAPFNAVPVEVLALIFEFLIDCEGPRPKLRYRNTLKLVSKAWSRVLFEHPPLWTTRKIRMTKTGLLGPKDFFKPSGELPMDLHVIDFADHSNQKLLIDIPAVVESVRLTNESHWLYRIRTLTVEGCQPFCIMYGNIILSAILRDQHSKLSPPSLLIRVNIVGQRNRRCKICGDLPAEFKELAIDSRNFPRLTLAVTSREPSTVMGLTLLHLTELTLSTPNIQWENLWEALESAIQMEKLSLIRIMGPLVLASNHTGQRLLTLASLESLTVEAFSYKLLFSILRSFDTPNIKHLGVGIAHFNQELYQKPISCTPDDIDGAYRDLIPRLDSFKHLTSLTIRAYIPIQSKLVAMLGQVILPDGQVIEHAAPKLLHLSLPHLNPYRDLSSSELRLYTLWKALETVSIIRQRNSSRVVNLQSLAIPRCLFEKRKKSLRTAFGARIIKLDCECNDEWWAREGDIDPESGWDWDSSSIDPDWYHNMGEGGLEKLFDFYDLGFNFRGRVSFGFD
ncbi:hypothetical protein DL93DRAFT_2156819 [Clavulina sp. PMI_390]|nr:hypothetical protein DL93DRAFT_2156819 [Clavulina sp. PMI_390]